jgi:putative transposase
MLVQIPPKISVSSFVGDLKGKSSLMIFDKHASLKYRYGNREFWCRGYYVDTVGKNKKEIAEYNTISKVLFFFKQHTPKIKFGFHRTSIIPQNRSPCNPTPTVAPQ